MRSGLVVRPLERGEGREQFDAELRAHHWLGDRLFEETVCHVATDRDGRWLALVGFGSAALLCGPRDRFVGWSDDQRRRRLRFVVNNQRFCVLPGRRPNMASAVLARSLRRLSGDYESRWGHAVLVVETFVDPSRHTGACYRASEFEVLGATAGWGRRGGRYVHHGQPKLCLVRPLRRGARRVLAARFDHPLLVARTRETPVLDLNTLCLDSEGGLLERLEGIEDHRKARGGAPQPRVGARDRGGCDAVGRPEPIGEWAADAPQDVLARLGARFHPDRHCYIPPTSRRMTRPSSERSPRWTPTGWTG